MFDQQLSRRQTLAALGAGAAYPLVSGCAQTGVQVPAPEVGPAPATTTDAQAITLLDIRSPKSACLSPEGATSLGIDNGDRAAMRYHFCPIARARSQASAPPCRRSRSRPGDRSSGCRIRSAQRRSRRSAYSTALEGFAYIRRRRRRRLAHTPYVVIQNVGAYLDVPRFLDRRHPIEMPPMRRPISPASNLPHSSTCDLGRISAAGRQPRAPTFLIDKAITQLNCRQGRSRRRQPG